MNIITKKPDKTLFAVLYFIASSTVNGAPFKGQRCDDIQLHNPQSIEITYSKDCQSIYASPSGPGSFSFSDPTSQASAAECSAINEN